MPGQGASSDIGNALVALPQLVTLRVACELIPMPSMAALYIFLHRYQSEFPARYRHTKTNGGPSVPIRLLTIEECKRIREMTIRTDIVHARSGARKRSLLDRIAARARGFAILLMLLAPATAWAAAEASCVEDAAKPGFFICTRILPSPATIGEHTVTVVIIDSENVNMTFRRKIKIFDLNIEIANTPPTITVSNIPVVVKAVTISLDGD